MSTPERPPRPDARALRDRRQRRIALGSAAGIVAVTVALTLLGWEWAHTSRPDMAQWAMAASSIGTLAAAVIAAVFAAGAFRLESDREDRWSDTQRRTQASVVAAWPSASGVSVRSGELDPETLTYPERGPDRVTVLMRNASDVPVTTVVITVLMRTVDPGGVEHGSYVFGETIERLVPPSSGELTIFVHANPFVPTASLIPEGVASIEFHPYVAIEFTDASGYRWLRTHEGMLFEVTRPVRETRPLRRTSDMFRRRS